MRAEVVESGSGQVKLFFIDLGEQDLRELPKNIPRKPPLVLCTGLANLSPRSQGKLLEKTFPLTLKFQVPGQRRLVEC